MKKILLLSVLLFAVLIIKANPIIHSSFLITELYFDSNDKWTMELLIKDQIINLDNYKLITSTGEFHFKNGITVNPNDIILITIDSMQTPLTLNRSGDFIQIKWFTNSQWFDDGIPLRYGNITNAAVSPPLIGQSIELLIINGTFPAYSGFAYIKSKTPDLGSINVNTSNCMGNLNGFVYDINNNPVAFDSVRIINWPQTNSFSNKIWFDATGYFNQEMYARNYTIQIYYPKTSSIPCFDTIISIELDSTVSCIFHINNYVSSISEQNSKINTTLSNFPNPFTTSTNILINISDSKNASKAILKFFNSVGEIVRIIPVDGYAVSTAAYSIPFSIQDMHEFTSGTYYYVLELNGEKLASNKMTLIK